MLFVREISICNGAERYDNWRQRLRLDNNSTAKILHVSRETLFYLHRSCRRMEEAQIWFLSHAIFYDYFMSFFLQADPLLRVDGTVQAGDDWSTCEGQVSGFIAKGWI